MSDFIDDWGLTVAVFLPLVGALVMLVVPRREEATHKLLALVTTVATTAVGMRGTRPVSRKFAMIGSISSRLSIANAAPINE